MALPRSRRTRGGLAVAAALSLALTGCGGDGGSDVGGQDATAPGADAITEPVTIEFWHSMKEKNELAVKALADDFRKVNDKITVKPVFKGDYDQMVVAYKQAIQQEATPPLVQIYDIGSRFMYDAQQVVPMYKFIEQDKFDQSANIEPNIASYYTIKGKLWSMPFNSSAPLLYMNADAVRKAGLDPDKPPATLDEIGEWAKKLTVKDGGTVTQFGFNAALYGWFVEQLTAQDNAEYCDNGNGRNGLATKVNFGTGAGPKFAQWLGDLVKQGYATNTGRPTDQAQNAFKTGTIALHLESTSALGGYTAAAKDKFELRTAPFPKPSASSGGGTIIGGASLWINAAGHTDAEKRAAWEFVKFANTPEQQAKWHAATGYVPVNPQAKSNDDPNFQVAVTQLRAQQPSPATSGCLLGVMPEARKGAEVGLEQAVPAGAGQEPRMPAEQAMQNAAATLQSPIQKYNANVGQ
ncbi:ABC transporter substrate-binding protein [Nonomuraea sp. MG754425]|uniref:ABC transporter substrate-binding protein n=1 Tax=Nonomuraea sp. MG754425 TaxID=2570319 RepID=UPI001F356D27|nr:ABC transporter substrate-binding protein [Nonomuraea sp. MG754425]MCF6473376.1 ABC transporter substrate-binding protein [Nonomuraea sp. MG754425]